MDTNQNEGDERNPNGPSPERTELTHGDEYKMLREEIMLRIKATHQTELFGAIGVGLVYSWLILHKSDISSPILWFIGPTVVLLCAISNFVNIYEMRRIGEYLSRIEEAAFGADEKLIGWEREQRVQHRAVNAHFALSVIIWVLVFGVTIWASCVLSQT